MKHQSYKTLVVDDDPKIRQLIRVNLEPRGFIVQEAPDGLGAMKAIEADLPDLMLLDLVMPGIDGIEVCLWVRERFDLPIIVLSAQDEEQLKVRALDAGADDYVSKPFSYEELLARVWGPEYFDANHYLHIYFGRIRSKMGPKYGPLLETVPGMGYSLRSSLSS